MGIINHIKGLFTRRAWSPLDDRWYEILSPPSNSGVNVTEETAMNSTAVYACVKILAETVASLPLVLFKREKKGRSRATDNPLYNLMHDRPNPEMSAFNFTETKMFHLTLWGNFYAQIERDRLGVPIALWPLPPNRVNPIRDGKRLIYEFKPGSGQTYYIPAQNMLHIPGMGFDGIKGHSVISTAREAIGLSLAAEEFGARFFGNGAIPGLVLTHPAQLSIGAKDNITDSWNKAHKGVKKSHLMAVLEEGMTIDKVGIPPQDAQFLETRKFQTVEIARIFRVPPHMIGDLDRATFSNIEHQGMEFVTYTLNPWLVRDEQVCNYKLLSDVERKIYYYEYVVDALLRGDIAARYSAYAIGRQWGWLSPNDIREKENMNPIKDGGNIYLVPMNMVPSDQAGQLPESTPNDKPEEKPVEEKSLRMAGAVLNKEQRNLKALQMRNKIVAQYRPVFLDAAARLVTLEGKQLRRQIKASLRNKGSIADFEVWLEDFYKKLTVKQRKIFAPTYNSFAEAIQDVVAQERGIESGMTPELEKYMSKYQENSERSYSGSSSGQLKQLIRENADTPPEEIADVLESRIDEWDTTRADKIMKQETVAASNAVVKFVYIAAGVSFLRWVAQGSKSCPYCQEMDGRVIGINSVFVSKGDELNPEGADGPMKITGTHGHPPLHGGCVCGIMAD